MMATLYHVWIILRYQRGLCQLLEDEIEEQSQETEHCPNLEQSWNGKACRKAQCMVSAFCSMVFRTMTVCEGFHCSVASTRLDHQEEINPVPEEGKDSSSSDDTRLPL